MRRRIALAPLSDSETAALVTELLGPDPSVGGLATMIAERAAGNPFFAEEMVRELAERGVLRGQPRRLRCRQPMLARSACQPPCRRLSPRASTGLTRRPSAP